MLNFRTTQPGVSGILTASGTLTIPYANELKTALVNSLAGVNHLELDFEKVTEVDLACLQLLCSAHLACEKMHKKLTMSGCSEPFRQAVNDAGYTRIKRCTVECKENCLVKGDYSWEKR